MNKIIKKIWPIFIPIGLAIITFLTYFPSLYYAFQFDDEPSIINFYGIRNKTLSELFFSSSRWVSYWLNTIHYKWGLFSPFVYRRSNIIFHCLTGILLYILISQLLKLRKKDTILHNYAYTIAGITSALFLLHPVQTQTVSYVIQGQLEGISALFCLAIITCFVIFATTSQKLNKFISATLIIALSVIACGTKEITIILPFLIPLVDWFFIAQGNWQSFKKRIWMDALIAATTWGCYLWLLGKNFFIIVLSLQIEHTNTIGNVITQTGEKITPWPFFISQFKVILHYLAMYLWPFNICIDYDWKICTGVDSPDCILPFLVLLTILGTIIWALKKNRISLYAFSLLWFFICMAPRSTIMPSTELMADYKTYLASVGWLFLISLALFFGYYYLAKNYSIFRKKIITALLIITGLTSLSFITLQRNKVWKSGLAFWSDVVAKSPQKARGYNNYGTHLLKNNDIKAGIWCFKKAIQLEPFTYPDPYNNLSAAYALQNNFNLAIKTLKASLKINPGQPRSYNNLGIYLRETGDLFLAEKCFKQAITINPHYGKAFHNLAKLYKMQNKAQEAWECLKSACTQADYDNDIDTTAEYGQLSMHLKQYADAVTAYQLLSKLKPDDNEATLNLANAYLMNTNYEHAQELYETLKMRNPYDIRILCNLTECYIRLQKAPQALELIQSLEQESKDYPHMKIHKARALHMVGKSREAQLLLYDFIGRSSDSHMKHIAREIIQQIDQEDK